MCLSNKLTERWPGLVLPAMPPKELALAAATMSMTIDQKMIEDFYTERHYLLQRLLRSLSKLDFILDSEEFQLFIQANDGVDVGSQITKLPARTLQMTYMHMAEALNISMSDFGSIMISEMNSEIFDYLAYCRKVEPLLTETFGVEMERAHDEFESVRKNYKNMAWNLTEYEKENLHVYSDYDESEKIITSERNPEL